MLLSFLLWELGHVEIDEHAEGGGIAAVDNPDTVTEAKNNEQRLTSLISDIYTSCLAPWRDLRDKLFIFHTHSAGLNTLLWIFQFHVKRIIEGQNGSCRAAPTILL